MKRHLAIIGESGSSIKLIKELIRQNQYEFHITVFRTNHDEPVQPESMGLDRTWLESQGIEFYDDAPVVEIDQDLRAIITQDLNLHSYEKIVISDKRVEITNDCNTIMLQPNQGLINLNRSGKDLFQLWAERLRFASTVGSVQASLH